MITHLYIKTHNKTGLKYFGKTTQDPYVYRGSGTRWISHIRKHGYDVATRVIASFDVSQRDSMIDFALSFSELFDIVGSNDWANLVNENGIDGGDRSSSRTYRPASKEARQKMSISALNRSPITKTTKDKISRALKGKSKPPRSKQHRDNLSRAMSGANHPNYGKQRSEEAKQKISQSQSGENGYWFGKRQSDISRQKRSDSLKKRYEETNGHRESTKCKIGEKARGTTHITNGTINKRINTSSTPIPNGFWVGYTKIADKPTNKGRRWITDGIVNRCVHVGLDFEMPSNFRFGKTERVVKDVI